MVRQSKGKKAAVGKGKLTPIQIAFIVDRYLADNNYTNALSAFRAEAHDLFSKTKVKEAPKGLMGLGDILDEYITLKEQRVMVDQEKRRIETALRGIQDVMWAYNHPLHPPSTPLPPSHATAATQMTAATAIVSPPNRISDAMSPTGHLVPQVNYTQPPPLPLKADELNKLSTPVPKSSSDRKRKAIKNDVNNAPVESVLKRPYTRRAKASSLLEGKSSCTQATFNDNTKEDMANLSAVQSTLINNEIVKSPVAKSLFQQQPESRSDSSSPKTPAQASPSQLDKLVSPEGMSMHPTDAAAPREIASTNCSIFSSETIIVSPIKRTGYYAIERSYKVTSPFKPSPKKLGGRDHVKGRLRFDEPEMPLNLENPVVSDSSTSSTGEEATENFHYDFSDIFNEDFPFPEFLSEIDFDCDGIPSCQPSSVAPDCIPGPEHNISNECSETSQALHGTCRSTTITKVLAGDMNTQGSDSVTSMRTVTKCFGILSPSKARGNC